MDLLQNIPYREIGTFMLIYKFPFIFSVDIFSQKPIFMLCYFKGYSKHGDCTLTVASLTGICVFRMEYFCLNADDSGLPSIIC